MPGIKDLAELGYDLGIAARDAGQISRGVLSRALKDSYRTTAKNLGDAASFSGNVLLRHLRSAITRHPTIDKPLRRLGEYLSGY
jgi:hypothetical protein